MRPPPVAVLLAEGPCTSLLQPRERCLCLSWCCRHAQRASRRSPHHPPPPPPATMPGTDWVAGLTVVKLKEELKKRGQAVAGKKAELVARLEEYIQQNEVRRAGA